MFMNLNETSNLSLNWFEKECSCFKKKTEYVIWYKRVRFRKEVTIFDQLNFKIFCAAKERARPIINN